MNEEQKEIVNVIIKRWHAVSYKGLTLQQAALDIGYLCGLLMALVDAEKWPNE